MHHPTTAHWTVAKGALHYLKGSVDFGLFYRKGRINLHAYCDSDWAGNPDDRRSTIGYGIFLGPILSLGALRSNTRSLGPAQRRNIAT